MTKKEMVEQALGRVMLAREHRLAMAAAVRYSGAADVDYPHALNDRLYAKETEAWNDLLMWGLVADQETQDRIKAAVHERYLSDRSSVARYVDPNDVGVWANSTAEEFREMARKAFAPRDTP